MLWNKSAVVLEKTLGSPLDCKEIKPVNPKREVLNIHWKDWCWSKTPILWQPDVKNWLIRKDTDAGKDWRWKEKGTAEDAAWMLSRTRWTWVWASYGSWWWTGRPGMLKSMGSQRVKHDWATGLNLTMKENKAGEGWGNKMERGVLLPIQLQMI